MAGPVPGGSRHTVKGEPRRPAEHEQIPGEQLDIGPRAVAVLGVAEAEDAGVAEAERNHRRRLRSSRS